MNLKKHLAPILAIYQLDPALLEVPQDRTMGDLAMPCFTLAKQFKKSPIVIATEMAAQIQPTWPLEQVQATWPYLNFFFDTTWLAQQTISEIQASADAYGTWASTGERILVESPGPNTNKPLHLGHVRNMLLGNALKTVLQYAGHKVVSVDIINDRGVHICKSMLAYKKFGNGEQPSKKPDHYVWDRYVRYDQELKQNPKLSEEIQTMLQKREEWDTQVRELWNTMRTRALDGMAETYKRFGTHIDKAYYESDHYLKWKAIVQEGLDTGIFSQGANGNIMYHHETLWDKVMLRSDGTSIYITQDIALGKLRYEDFSMDRMIYVVGNEQEHHFKFLFEIFKTLGYSFADKCHHLSYGMVELPDGKMKSREWTVVDADTMVEEMISLSQTVLKERYPLLDQKELDRRSEVIAMGAIKYFILKYDANKNFVFDKNTSLRFDGETGPYLQYTYARCSWLSRKGQQIDSAPTDRSILSSQKAKLLLLHLGEFPATVQQSAEKYQPYLIARYLLDLAQLFNSFYQSERVVDEENLIGTATRLVLVWAVQQVMGNGLKLLGIETLEEM